jgi:hypothetical protein
VWSMRGSAGGSFAGGPLFALPGPVCLAARGTNGANVRDRMPAVRGAKSGSGRQRGEADHAVWGIGLVRILSHGAPHHDEAMDLLPLLRLVLKVGDPQPKCMGWKPA